MATHRRPSPIACPELIIWRDGDDRTTITTSPNIMSGTDAPSASATDGSIYLRTTGAASSTLYVRVGGAWVAIDTSSSSVTSGDVKKGWYSTDVDPTGNLSGGAILQHFVDANGRPWTARIGTTSIGTSGPDVVEIDSSGNYHLQWGVGTTSSTTFDMKDTYFGAPKFSTALFRGNEPLDSIELVSTVTATGRSGVATNTFATGIHIMLAATYPTESGASDYHYIAGQVAFSASSDLKVRLRRNLNSSLTLIQETSSLAGIDMSTGLDLKLTLTQKGIVTLGYRQTGVGSYTNLTTTTIADYKPVAVGVHGSNASATITGTALDTYISLPTLTHV